MASRRSRERMVVELVQWGVLFSGSRAPGAVVKRFMLNGDNREIIQSLTADDFNHPATVKEWLATDISSKVRKART